MSTFKRLFNVGKGKAKVTRNSVSSSLADGTDGMRHAAADAAEAFADAVRPPDPVPAREDVLDAELRSTPAPSSVPEPTPVASDPVDVEEVVDEAPPQTNGPPKRSL